MEPLKGVDFPADTSFNDPAGAAAARVASGPAVGALRNALQAQLRGEARDGAVHQALQSMCADGKCHGLRVEQLLVILKDAWHSLPDVRRLPVGSDRDRLLGYVVTMCIEEYYRTDE